MIHWVRNNRVLRKIFNPEGVDLTEGWRDVKKI
jgi:hypothetical protein